MAQKEQHKTSLRAATNLEICHYGPNAVTTGGDVFGIRVRCWLRKVETTSEEVQFQTNWNGLGENSALFSPEQNSLVCYAALVRSNS